MAVQPCVGDQLPEGRLQPIPETSDVVHAGEVLSGTLRRLPQPDDADRILGARTEPALLFSAVDERIDDDALLHVQGADALRSVDLVPGEREEVDVQLLHVDRNPADRLRGVRMEEHAATVCDPHQVRYRLDRAGLVVCHHDGDEQGVGPQLRLEIVRPDPAVPVHRQVRHVEAEGLQPSAGLDHGRVLDGGDDDVPLPAVPVGKRQPLDDRVVRLRAAAGERDPPRRAVEQPCDAPPCGFNAEFCRLPLPVDARRVPGVVLGIRRHRLPDLGIERGRRVVVQVDPFDLRSGVRRCGDPGDAGTLLTRTDGDGLPGPVRLHHVAEQRLIDRKPRYGVVAPEIGQLVHVTLLPGRRRLIAAAAHVRLDGPPDDVVGDDGAERDLPPGGPHNHPVAVPDAAGFGVLRVDRHRRLGPPAKQALDAVVLGVEVSRHPGAGVEDQRKPPGKIGFRERPLLRFGVDRQRVVAVLLEDRRPDLEPARRRVEARLPVGPQQSLLPLSVLQHHGRRPYRAARRPHVLQRKTRALQHVPEQRLLVLGVEVAVAEPPRQLRHDEDVVPGLAERLDDPLPDAEDRSIGHVGFAFVHRGGGQHDIRVGRIRREVTVDADQEIQVCERLPPDRGLRPGYQDVGRLNDQGPDPIRLPLQDRLGQRDGVPLLPVVRVDRKPVRPDGGVQVWVGDVLRAVDGEDVLLHGETASAGDIQLPCHGPEDEDRPDRLYARIAVLEPRVHRKRGSIGVCDPPGERDHRLRRNAGDPLHHLRAEVLDVVRKLIEPERPVPDELLVVEILFDDDVAHPQRQRPVRSRADRHPVRSSEIHGLRAAGIDHHHLCPPPARLHDPLQRQGAGSRWPGWSPRPR